MKGEVRLVEIEAKDAICIRTRVPMEQLPQVIGSSYGRICGYLAGLGEEPAGMPFIAYHNMDMSDLDVEIGFPVRRKLPASGELISSRDAGGLCVEAEHEGPYSEMVKTYGAMADWMAEKGYESAGPAYEYYYNSPAEVPEAELLTRIVFPVRKKA